MHLIIISQGNRYDHADGNLEDNTISLVAWAYNYDKSSFWLIVYIVPLEFKLLNCHVCSGSKLSTF